MIKQLLCATLLAVATGASANDFVDRTFLLDIKQGGQLSDKANSMKTGGYESADGDAITFKKWYSTDLADMHISFITQVSKQFGVIWGFSTGERAEKYKIDPSFKLGAVFVQPVSKTAKIALRVSYTFAGKLREKPCVADYGDIAGVKVVNCRLAAADIAPEDTLQYLLNERPRDYKQASIQFSWAF